MAACAAWWFSLAYQPAKVIPTAPTDRQVRQLRWAEIRSLHGNARIPMPGQVLTTHWQMPGQPDWYMTGFATTPDSAQEHATRFQGYHSPNLLLIFDERQASSARSGTPPTGCPGGSLRAEAESLGPETLDEVVDCLEDGRGLRRPR